MESSTLTTSNVDDAGIVATNDDDDDDDDDDIGTAKRLLVVDATWMTASPPFISINAADV